MRRGFTLIEVLAVILMTTILLGVALDFYVDLSRQSARASDYTREIRRASSILDRIAADFEHAMLVRKPAEMDPLEHPWVFVAEPRFAEEGSDRVKFVARQRVDRRSEGAESDVVQIAYSLRKSEEGEGHELRRWSSPGLSDGLDRAFPPDDDPDSLLLADGLERFELRFLDETGEWLPAWDSSQLLESSELPLAVEIEVALLGADPVEDDLDPDFEALAYVRQVRLPLRPLDLAVLTDPVTYTGDALGDAEGGDGDLAGLSIADCVDFSSVSGGTVPAPGLAGLAEAGIDPSDLQTLFALQQQAQTTPFAPYARLFANTGAVRPECR